MNGENLVSGFVILMCVFRKYFFRTDLVYFRKQNLEIHIFNELRKQFRWDGGRNNKK